MVGATKVVVLTTYLHDFLRTQALNSSSGSSNNNWYDGTKDKKSKIKNVLGKRNIRQASSYHTPKNIRLNMQSDFEVREIEKTELKPANYTAPISVGQFHKKFTN